MSSKRDVSDELNERHRRLLIRLLKEDGNKECADCRMRNPTWASVNLGVFVCLTCSGIHRSLGVHISQVRSTNLDTWLPKQVEYISCMGNVKANRYWEAQLPPEFRRPSGVSPNAELQAFIRNKYCEKRYAATDVQAPNIDNYRSHPYITSEETKPEAAAVTTPSRATVTVPLPKSQTALSDSSSSLPPPPTAAPAPAVDLLGFDDDAVPSSAPVPAPAAAPLSMSDPFALLASSQPSAAPPAAAVQSAANDWSDFTASSAPTLVTATVVPTTTPAAAPVLAATAPSKAIDPFGNLGGGGLVDRMQEVSIHSPAKQHQQPMAAPSKSAVSPDDILKLFDSQSGNGFGSDFFSAAPTAAPAPMNRNNQPSAPLSAQHFTAPVMPNKGPALGMQMPMHPPAGGMPNAPQPGFGNPGMIPAYAGMSHGGFPQPQQFGMPQGLHGNGFGSAAPPQFHASTGIPSYGQPSLQQQAGLLNNPAAFANLVSMQSPGFGGKKA